MNYYNEIKNRIIDNEIYSKVKDYSKKLKTEINKNYSVRLLYKMRKYYKFASNEKLPTLSANLSWSHYDEILRFDEINKITYYINACNNAILTIRQLREKIKSKEYELI